MKRQQVLFALLAGAVISAVAFLPAAGGAEGGAETALRTTIVSATVYGGQAQIVRRGEVELQSGRMRLLCRDLPSAFIESSLIIEGAGTSRARIVGIDLVREDSVVQRLNRFNELNRDLEHLKSVQKDLLVEKDALSTRRDLLQSILESYSSDKTKTEFTRQAFSIPEWKSLLDFYQGERERMGKELNALEKKNQVLEDKIGMTTAEMARTNAGEPSSRAVAIDCEVESAGTLTVDLSYIVPGASWAPEYTVLFDESSERIELAYDARIQQATGEDWKGVATLLSTAEPQIGAAPPALMPLTMGFYEAASAVIGRVIDTRTKKPLAFANVVVVGTQLGAMTDANGSYRIDNVPVGAYEVKAMMMGYRPSTRRGVLVSAGRMVKAGFEMEQAVVGKTMEISTDNVVAAVALKSGIVRAGDELHLRGGRSRAVQSQVDAMGNDKPFSGGAPDEDALGGVGVDLSVEALPLSYEEAAVATSEFTANLQIKTPVDLESGAEPKRALIVREQFGGAVARHTIPSLSEHVFLEGTFENSLAVPLLPGVAEVYVESTPVGASNRVSTFVGREAIDGVAPAKAFTVHLGIDQSLKVTHELEKKEYLSKSGQKTNKVRYHYLITIESFRKDACEVKVEDRIPTSASAQIKISDVEIMPLPTEQQDNGLAMWKVPLAPGGKASIRMAYTIAFPGGRTEGELMMSE